MDRIQIRIGIQIRIRIRMGIRIGIRIGIQIGIRTRIPIGIRIGRLREATGGHGRPRSGHEFGTRVCTYWYGKRDV